MSPARVPWIIRVRLQVEHWRPFFDTYGIVVIRNIVSDEDCDATVADMWASMAQLGMLPDVC
jgi:hypothetical protein